jgi:sterol desaturase/sphingolipid hydroxylase (fatty acid hydroxylase superfamily)
MATIWQTWTTDDGADLTRLFLIFECLRVAVFAIEFGYSRLFRVDNFSYAEFANSWSMFMIEMLLDFITGGSSIWLFVLVYKHRLLNINALNPAYFVLGLAISDFAYYWAHRFLHTYKIGWASHSAHHATTKYNISVSFRRGLTLPGFSIAMFLNLLLPLFGFSPIRAFLLITLHRFYMITSHTNFIPKIPFLGRIFLTPYDHRVHHSPNREHNHCNYSGLFVFYDHLFGTYREVSADTPIKYGLLKQRPENILILVFGWIDLFSEIWKRKTPMVLLEKMGMTGEENIPSATSAQTEAQMTFDVGPASSTGS